MTVTMSDKEYSTIRKSQNGIRELIEQQFKQNRREHNQILTQLGNMDSKIETNTRWINQNKDFIEELKRERNNQRLQLFNSFIKTLAIVMATLISTGILLILGVSKFG